jgi:hypothetical protein
VSNQNILTTDDTSLNFGNGDFSVDFWFKLNTITINKNAFEFYCKVAPAGTNASSVSLRSFIFQDNTVWFCVGVGGSYYSASSTKKIQDTDWHHVATVRQGTNLYLFVDGELWGSSSNIGLQAINNLAEPFIIGQYPGSMYDYWFNGYIDEFRISNIARWVPINLTAITVDSRVGLSWNTFAEATSFCIKRSTTVGGPYTTVASNVTGTSYEDSTVKAGETYYYVVAGMSSNGVIVNSNEASVAIPLVVLLRITMNDSSEREYRVTDSDVDAFVKWYDRTIGTGNTCYIFNDSVDGSKEYLAFEKIISFKVILLVQ